MRAARYAGFSQEVCALLAACRWRALLVTHWQRVLLVARPTLTALSGCWYPTCWQSPCRRLHLLPLYRLRHFCSLRPAAHSLFPSSCLPLTVLSSRVGLAYSELALFSVFIPTSCMWGPASTSMSLYLLPPVPVYPFAWQRL